MSVTPATRDAGPRVAGGLASAEARARLLRDGPNEVPEKRTHPIALFAKKFWGLSAWMLELIVFLSLLLHKHADFWIALALLVVNAVLSFAQEQRASTAVAALRRQLHVTARALRDGAWATVPARELVSDDVIRVRIGDFVPADLRLLDGELDVDQSTLTGESQEITKRTGDSLYSGSVVRQGEGTGAVVATGVHTYFGRTTQLVDSARPRLHVEEVVTRVVKWLFMIVGVQVALVLMLSFMTKSSLVEILPLALVLLMSAVPVALPVMFTVSMAVGSMELAKRGVLITRLSAAEDAATMDVLCADKTGTLTMNRLEFVGASPEAGFVEADVLESAALASNEANQDPIDVALLGAARERGLLHETRAIEFHAFSPKTRRTEAVAEIEGRRLRVMKGALRAIAEVVGVERNRVAAIEDRLAAQAEKGIRFLAVARAIGEEPLRLVGFVLLHDPPRRDSRRLIAELRNLGVTVKMLTGDALPVGREIARSLGIGGIAAAWELRAAEAEGEACATDLVHVANGFAEVYPEDKFRVVTALQAAGHVTGMTGDGVNDAPALRQAEVGIAVSGASDVAKGAASVALTTEGLAGIVDLVKNGRAIYQRVLTWIINKVSRTILKSGYVVIAFLFTGKFVISALGMVLLVFMTDFVKIALSTDRVRPSDKPETWNIGPLVRIAVVLGILMLAEALVLLAFGLRHLGLSGGRLHTFAFQTLLFFALFSIISIRERRAFWASRPGALLSAALAADACAGVAVGSLGLAGLRPLPPAAAALTLGYALVCSLAVNDAVKAALVAKYWTTRDGP